MGSRGTHEPRPQLFHVNIMQMWRFDMEAIQMCVTRGGKGDNQGQSDSLTCGGDNGCKN